MDRRTYLAMVAGAAVGPQHVRREVSPRVDASARRFLGVYAAYQLLERERIGTTWAPRGRQDVIQHLLANGYEYNVLAAAKRHPDDGRIDIGSYRRVPEEHPDVDDYEWGDAGIVEEWEPADCQYHVHLFDTDTADVVELFSHYELRPDLFNPDISPRRVRIHYSPTQHENYLYGVADSVVREYGRDVDRTGGATGRLGN